MSRFVRAAQTTQSLSLAAMEEASRAGLRVADLEHLFLALVISDQPAGGALRSMGIDLDGARRAVEEERAAQLASLGIEASFPEAGRIVFHETDGYEWSKRASDLIARSISRDDKGDAAAVLRELVTEPSGLIASILDRLGATPRAVLDRLAPFDVPVEGTATTSGKTEGCVTGSIETFVAAPIEEVWRFLVDPRAIPDWEMSIGTIDHGDQDPIPGMVLRGLAPVRRPDGKPLTVKPRFRRRSIELVAAHRPERMAYFERRRAEQLTDRDIMRCLKRHVANEVYAALLNPATDNPAGRELRARRQAIGIPISVLAATLGVPYQRLRRLEIGTRADPDLEARATAVLERISPPLAA